MTQATETPFTAVKVREVVGVDVKNKEGKDLGTINDIILDKYSGEVRYVVLSFGGLFGLGDKLFALPWKSIYYDENKNCFILDISKEKLENAPGFDKNNWPNMSDRTWEENIYHYYKVKPYWDEE